MTSELKLALPESSPYQCDRDFILIEDGGRFCWEGTGDYEGDHCGFKSIVGLRTLLPMLSFGCQLLMEKMLQQLFLPYMRLACR